MNKSRRKRIAVAIRDLKKTTKHNFIDNYIDFIKDEIEDILWEENDAYDNMPESLQYSIRGVFTFYWAFISVVAFLSKFYDTIFTANAMTFITNSRLED